MKDESLLQSVLRQLQGVHRSGSGYSARCPAHEDSNPSLSVTLNDVGKLFLKCHAGCDWRDVRRSLGLETPAGRTEGKRQRCHPSATGELKAFQGTEGFHIYRDAAENPAFAVHRSRGGDGSKRIRQYRPGGPDSWLPGLGGVKTCLYRLPEVLRCVEAGDTIFVVEGEKCVEALVELGIRGATTNPMGAGKWKAEYSDVLRGAKVVILPDNDEPGRRHGDSVAASLYGRARSIKLIDLSGLPAAGDIVDWLAAGYSRKDLEAIVHAAPDQGPPTNSQLAGASASTVAAHLGQAAPTDQARDLIVPQEYRLRETGTYSTQVKAAEGGRRVESEVLFAHAPILVTGKLRDECERRESLRIRWLRKPGVWSSTTVDRGIALNKSRIVELASEGFPVTSGTAPALVKYLGDFEASNFKGIPVGTVSSQLGWQGDHRSFLWGRTLLSDGARTCFGAVEELDPVDWPLDGVAFRGRDGGEDQLAAGFHSMGSYEGWVEAVAPIQRYPRVLTAFYASLAAPLLQILKVPNFGIHFWKRTSVGKTTMLRVGASNWGTPTEAEADSVIRTWDATAVALERTAELFLGLPLFLDEASRIKEPAVVTRALYAIGQGQARSRGSKAGLARTGTFRTILLSTGEGPISSGSEKGGARVRVLEISGLPFDGDGADTHRVVLALNEGLRANYGHAGPRFVEGLLSRRDKWPRYRDYLTAARKSYLELAAGPEAGRIAEYAGVISVAGALAHDILGLPWPFRDPLKELWPELSQQVADAAGTVRALRAVMSFANAHQTSFEGRFPRDKSARTRSPSGKVLGRWPADSDWKYIGFLPNELRSFLFAEGFDYDAVLAEWRERRWIKAPQRDRFTCKDHRLHGEPTWMIIVLKSGIEAAGA